MSCATPKCQYCFEPMKPLFQSFYCKNDCDRPEVRAKLLAEAKEKLEAAAKKLAENRIDPDQIWGYYYNPRGIQDPDPGALN